MKTGAAESAIAKYAVSGSNDPREPFVVLIRISKGYIRAADFFIKLAGEREIRGYGRFFSGQCLTV